MNRKIYIVLSMLLLGALLPPDEACAQYPGGVSTGTTRGYKIDYYRGSFTNVTTAFGAGTAKATPFSSGYTNKVLGTDYYSADYKYFGLEYTGTLEVPVAGSYQIRLDGIDDEAALYIDGTLRASGLYSGVPATATATATLSAGDHSLKIKYRNAGGLAAVTLQFIAVPAGSGITVPADLDGRFVRNDNTKLTAWYKASDLSVTANYSAGRDRVNGWTNKAPDYPGNGDLTYNGDASGSWADRSNNTQVNFNPAVGFSGDDRFKSSYTQNGISFRGATRSMFLVTNYITNAGVSQSSKWLFLQRGEFANNHYVGFWKGNSTQTQLGWGGGGASVTSAYTLNEPKLLTGFTDQATGGGAPSGLNPFSISANGTAGTSSSGLSNATSADAGLLLGASTGSTNYVVGATIPEMMYYPFVLSPLQAQKVNTYMAVKYGITMSQDYVSTGGTTIFSLAANAPYTNRIFGIGRELSAEGLNQKQSQSQMTSGTNDGYDFLLVSKGTAVTTTNTANTGILTDGDYLLLGDNGNNTGKLAIQTSELPVSYTASCTIARLNRAWKAQVTGTPGSVTIRAGSSTANSFLFPGNFSGLKLVVDGDGDGDFATGAAQQTLYDPSTIVNGVATFTNVNITNGNVFTFVWSITSPGGVSNGLALWLRGDAGTSTTTNGTATTTWNDLSNALTVTGTGTYKNDTAGNFNPYISFNGSNNYFAAPAGFANFTAGTSSFFVSNLANTSQNYSRFFDFGNGAPSNNITFGKSATTTNLQINTYNGGTGGGFITATSPIITGANRIYSMVIPGGTAGTLVTPALFTDGTGQAGAAASGGTVVPGNAIRNNNYIGRSNWSGDDYLNGSMSEGIIYNTALSPADQLRVNSYLALKYGRTLPASLVNYIASNGTTVMWNNATYWNDVFGIGRDDCSGLLQKQSKSTTAGDNVTIGLGTIAGTNMANTGTFAANNQYLVIGNDGGALTATASNVPASYTSCNAARYVRNWLVKNTNGVSNTLQVQVGNAANPIVSNWMNVTLAVSTAGDNTFASGVQLYPAAGINSGVATFNNVSLPDGAVFTVCFTIGYPGGVRTPSTVAANISGTNYINGLAYKSYTITSGAGRDLSVTPMGSLAGDVQVGSGIADAGTYTNTAVNATRMTNFGMTMTGKLRITSALTTYRFRIIADDQMYFELKNGATVVTSLKATANATVSNLTDVTLSAGDYDITIQGANNGSVGSFVLQWSTNSGGAYGAIPMANQLAPAPANGPGAWFEADNNLLTSQVDATNMAGVVWPDLSIGKNDVTGVGNPTYYSTTSSTGFAGMRNYNPGIYFTSDYFTKTGFLNGFAYGKTGKTILTVATGNTTSGNNTSLFGYGVDLTAGGAFVMNKITGGNLQLFTQSSNLTEGTAFYSGANANTTNLVSANINVNGNAFIHANGAQRATGILTFSTMPNDNAELQVGSAPDYSVNWDGNINEEIYYPWTLDSTERQKVNSYLAIKYGITFDQSTATNYLASDGTPIWTAATAGVFNRDITGIGRDDCGALYQKQSTSTDSADIVSIGKGGIATNNQLNTNTFAADKSFLVWARNSGDLNSNTVNMPSGLIGCYVRLNREWQVQTTGTPGPVSIQMGKNGLMNITGANYRPILIISNTAGNYTSATAITADSVRRGKAYFSNVTFANGQYFTLAFINAAPGGVTSGMTVWFNADYDAFTDVAQTTFAENDGDVVKSLSNLKYGATFSNVQEVGGSFNPVYKPGTFNYNAGIYFDGVNDVLATATAINTQDYRSLTAMTSVLAGKTVTGSTGQVFWFHDNNGAGTVKTSLERTKAYWSNSTANILGRSPALTDPEIYTFANSTSGSWRLYSNLQTVGNGATNASSTANVSSRFRIGNDAFGTGGTPANWTMGEFVIYSDDKGASTSTDMRKIHSYMATKYGFTLDQTAMGGAYYASDWNGTSGTITYNHTGYWNRITGIGRDDCSALEQKQSISQELTGALVQISNDPVNGLATTNAANTATFSNNLSFLLFGDNNKSLTWTGIDKIPGNLVRLNRIWRVRETGTVNSVYLQVPANTSSATYKLPAADVADVYLLVSHTGNFKNPDATVLMTPDGSDNLYVTYDFADGDYYTFASIRSCIAPAGISEGLTTWYRADNKSAGTLTSLPDETGNIGLVQYGTGVANVTAGGSANNYNNYLQLQTGTTGGSSFASTLNDRSETSLTGATTGTLYGVASGIGNSYLFTVSRPNFNTLNMTGASSSTVLNNATLNVNYPIGVVSAANFWGMTWDGTTVRAYTNGIVGSPQAYSTGLTANTTHYVGIGGGYNGPTYTRSGIAFNEAFSYSRALNPVEQQNLNSYLALKYGQTLTTQSYYSPDYDGTNDTTTTIYSLDVVYKNRIFGIGLDSAGCFSQNQSTSSLNGGMLKMSADGAITGSNSHNMSKFPGDRTYVAAGDDNGIVSSWGTTEIPAIYTSGSSCVIPQRIAREWRVKALNNDQPVLISIPDNSSSAATKLPALPMGVSKVYMIVNNNNSDFTTNASQEEIPMTLNTTSKEWEASYLFPAATSSYKYITFAVKPDSAGLVPKLVQHSLAITSPGYCEENNYAYYKGTAAGTGYTNNALLALNANGNMFDYNAATVTVDNSTTANAPSLNAGPGYGYYQMHSGQNTMRISKCLRTVQAAGSYDVNGGVIVRVYYDPAELSVMTSNAVPAGSNPIIQSGWFKSSRHNAFDVVGDMTSSTLANALTVTPVASGTEQGVSYVEFNVNSFSTFGYYAQTLPTPLPVELISFNALLSGCRSELSWKVANEYGLLYYEVEFSKDGASWASITTVYPLGNTSYTYSHDGGRGKLYYRLKLVSANGKARYSNVMTIVDNCDNSHIYVAPNPATDEFNVYGITEGTYLRLYDHVGKLVAEIPAGQRSVKVTNLAAGVYHLIATDKEGNRQSLKVIRQ